MDQVTLVAGAKRLVNAVPQEPGRPAASVPYSGRIPGRTS